MKSCTAFEFDETQKCPDEIDLLKDKSLWVLEGADIVDGQLSVSNSNQWQNDID